LGNGGALDLAPHTSVVHVSELLVDSFMPFGLLLWIRMVKGFVEGCGFNQPLLKSFFEVDGSGLRGLQFNNLVAHIKHKVGQVIDCCRGHIVVI